MPAPFSTPHSPVPLPALYLYPLNVPFDPKHIALLNNQRVKIGRQTNAKTLPAERNGYFDSKVLSRQHAEVWEESGKIYIKDVKSSNGTFINGERLSPEGLESEPFELKTDDIVEFGIDIVGEDNKSIIHHKVAARVVCVFTEQEAQAAARVEAQQNTPAYAAVSNQNAVANGSNAFSFANGQQNGVNGGPGAAQRRPNMQQQGLVGMGGMGGNVRPPGKSGLTFDHILSRLQGELQKSRETGAELHSLTGAMNEIHDTLGGNMPPNLAPYPQTLPPVMPPQSSQEQNQQPAAADSTLALGELQSQLRETQLSLASHVEKIRSLESMLAEHDAIKREVSSMRDMMEERKREMDTIRRHGGSPSRLGQHHDGRNDDAFDSESESDDDDARSINTVVPHELERVDEEDEDQMAVEEEEEERRRRRDEVRPRTPEPSGMGMVEDDDEREHIHEQHGHGRHRDTDSQALSHLRPRSPSLPTPALAPALVQVPDDLTERLTTLSKQLEAALELSRTLQTQHTTAQSTISGLESKVSTLETLVQATQAQVQAQAETTQQLAEAAEAARAVASEEPSARSSIGEEERLRERESLTEMLNEWKKNVEGQWSGVQEEWNEERERLKRAKEEWEARVHAVEEGMGSAVTKVESGLVSLATFQNQFQQSFPNGGAKMNGTIVMPPSPRSLSAESTRPRQRKKRNASRGRTRSRSTSTGPTVPAPDSSSVRGGDLFTLPGSRPRRRSPWTTDDSSQSDSETMVESTGVASGKDIRQDLAKGIQFLPTPEGSVVMQPLSSTDALSGTATDARTKEPPKDLVSAFHSLTAAVGFAVLGVATAAVLWRVNSEGTP
ncbi:hypothetical protein B0H21DRAFT_698552 [Amylocystis lapponica]|nr:hypothetical protein B0H21DRAFT_698552 [Amylocystis lapponica]